jgi:predicted nucleic acid-binding protein
VTDAWDTTRMSRVYPGGELEKELLRRARDDDHVAVASPTVMEVIRGLEASARHDERMASALAWFIRLTASGLFETLPLDRASAILAGRLRASHPVPPTGARRRGGTKPEQRAGWVLDIQIAACAWIHGRAVVTDNARDFEALRDAISELYPAHSPLVVRAR